MPGFFPDEQRIIDRERRKKSLLPANDLGNRTLSPSTSVMLQPDHE